MKFVSRYFINGLIVLAPITITVFIIVKIFSIADDLLGTYLPIQFPGISLLAVFLLIWFIGWISSNWMLKEIISIGEKILYSVPVVKVIYKSVKQVSTAVFESQQLFKHAVLVPYPHPGVKALGFTMTDLSEPMKAGFTEEHVCVFVPMSLNMTAGFNIIVPKRDIIPLDVTGESALQYVVTAGAIMPREFAEKSEQ